MNQLDEKNYLVIAIRQGSYDWSIVETDTPMHAMLMFPDVTDRDVLDNVQKGDGTVGVYEVLSGDLSSNLRSDESLDYDCDVYRFMFIYSYQHNDQTLVNFAEVDDYTIEKALTGLEIVLNKKIGVLGIYQLDSKNLLEDIVSRSDGGSHE